MNSKYSIFKYILYDSIYIIIVFFPLSALQCSARDQRAKYIRNETIGLTDNAFKKRWSNHCQSFKNEAHETSTELSKLIWRLKRADMKYTTKWQILTKCQSYKPGAKTCNLCLTEKLLIIKSPTSINSRTELVSICRHSRKFLIMHCC